MTGNLNRHDSYHSPASATIYQFDVADRKLIRSDIESNTKIKPSFPIASENFAISNKYVDYDTITCEFEEDSIVYDKSVETNKKCAYNAIKKAKHRVSPSINSGTLSTHTIFNAIEESCRKHVCKTSRSRSAKRTRDARDVSISSSSISCSTDSTYVYFNKRARYEKSMVPPPFINRGRRFVDLPMEWWERSERCKEAKSLHVAKIDRMCESREQLVLDTTLWREDTVLEPNMFPYDTPLGIEHFTLWSKYDMNHNQVVAFVDGWLERKFPQVRRWAYDDNLGERSFLLFHVHVFIETDPYSFSPQLGKEYFPPHCYQHQS